MQDRSDVTFLVQAAGFNEGQSYNQCFAFILDFNINVTGNYNNVSGFNQTFVQLKTKRQHSECNRLKAPLTLNECSSKSISIAQFS